MTMYWRLRSVPELADLPRWERKALWRRCQSRTALSGESAAWVLGSMALPIAFLSMGEAAGPLPDWAWTVFSAGYAMALCTVEQSRTLKRCRPMLARLRRRGLTSVGNGRPAARPAAEAQRL